LIKTLVFQDEPWEIELLKFVWDEAKNRINRAKHGISLAEACVLWDGAVLEAESSQPGESRKMAVGKIGGKFWTVIFTMRGETIRLISARRSRENEKNAYHEKDQDHR
jgi:uncharacterized DUF497 family protein